MEDSLDYFFFDDPKLGELYLLLKSLKGFQIIPAQTVISNSGYHIENISTFFEHYLTSGRRDQIVY